MEAVRQVLGTALVIDLAAGFLLLVLVWLAGKRSRDAGASDSQKGLIAAFGCLTVCLILVYAGLWMLTRTR
jgi:hypothetical protein